MLRLQSIVCWYCRWLERGPCVEGASSSGSMAATPKEERLVWVDLEMTGLDGVLSNHIMEMACIITDGNLDIVAEGPDLVIHQPDSILDNMGQWCTDNHGRVSIEAFVQSGLTAACRASQTTLMEAEELMLRFVQEHTPKEKCPLAGNSIHMDRSFLETYMPNFVAHVHYRSVDVSSVKELCRRWYPKEFSQAPWKRRSHRSLDDIKESIEELRYYRKTIFK